MSRAMGDVDEMQSFIVNGIDLIIGEGLLWLATVALVMLLDWRVASASLAPLMVVYVLLRIFNRKIKPIYKAARERAGDVSTRLQENLSGVVVIKIFGREKAGGASAFAQTTEAYYDQQIRAINARSIFFPFTPGVGFLSNVFMIGVGGYSILDGREHSPSASCWRFAPTGGGCSARSDARARQRHGPARRRPRAGACLRCSMRPDELPDAPDAITARRTSAARWSFADVTFRYPSWHPASRRPDARYGAARRLDPNRAGPDGRAVRAQRLGQEHDPESAAAFLRPDVSGTVTLDGRDLRSIRATVFGSHFALVQQETFLFNDSIFDNIRYGHADATMEQVIAAAKAANAHGFICNLPNGYDTKVGERGVRLSRRAEAAHQHRPGVPGQSDDAAAR